MNTAPRLVQAAFVLPHRRAARGAVLDSLAAELTAILQDCRPETLHVVYCDGRITATEMLTPDDLPLRLRARGSGGTDFRPPFVWVEEQSIISACFIYLTDLICRHFPPLPDYPVVRAVTGARTGPFGEMVKVDSQAYLQQNDTRIRA